MKNQSAAYMSENKNWDKRKQELLKKSNEKPVSKIIKIPVKTQFDFLEEGL